MNAFTASYRGYCSEWQRVGDTLKLALTVPADGRALLRRPDGGEVELAPGTHHFSIGS